MTIILDGTNGITSPGTLTVQQILSAQTALTGYLLPSMTDGVRGYLRAGFDWWSRNQQWGGPFGFSGLVDGATGIAYQGEAATSNIESVTSSASFAPHADVAADTWSFSGFKVPETQTVSAIWVKLYKVGNPTNNLQLFILPDDSSGTKPTGTTPITNGTATAQSGKLHTADTSGQWYRFVFPTPPSCIGGTQYHLVLKSSGAVDASNYWNIARATNKKYPFGNYGFGDGTPTWTASSTNCLTFIVELSASAQMLQTSGVFDAKLQGGGSGASGTLSMSRGLCSSVPLRELINVNDFTLRIVGSAFTKDATILDIGYGQDHDRIVLRSAVITGFATLTIYDSSGTIRTVTSSADISSGTQDILIRVRAKNDGADVMSLYVNGVSQGTPVTAASIPFDNLFKDLGTMWLLGGFALAPTWSGSSIGAGAFSGLPSTLGWTYSGAATEANAFSVSGGKLYQNKNGYTSVQDGYYRKTTAGLSNANGWAFNHKFRLASGTNDSSDQQCAVDIYDGTKRHLTLRGEYFLQRWDAGYYNTCQTDLKSRENIDLIIGKGSDCYQFLNNRLVLDGSGAMTSASATNEIDVGDMSITAGCNADVTHSYIKYYTTAWTPPQFTSGSISELAIWEGDRTALVVALYNAGTPISVKQFCGLPRNYVEKPIARKNQKGIIYTTTTASTTYALVPEMELYEIGESMSAELRMSASTTTAGDTVYASAVMDGNTPSSSFDAGSHQVAVNNYMGSIFHKSLVVSYVGLHKITGVWKAPNGNTATTAGTLRSLNVEAKV